MRTVYIAMHRFWRIPGTVLFEPLKVDSLTHGKQFKIEAGGGAGMDAVKDINFDEMSAEEIEKTLTPKERRFVWEYEMDWNGTQAAVRAGYSERSAAVTASRLLKKANVAAYARARQRDQFEALNINRETLAVKMVEVLQKCMEGTPHLVWDGDEHEYVPDGTYMFDSKGANSALKMLGDSIGMFQQNINHSGGIGIEKYLESLEQNGADEY